MRQGHPVQAAWVASMAYFCVLLSASGRQVRALQADSARLLRPTARIVVSHMLTYFDDIQPLVDLLAEAIDGGNLLSDAYRHPLRHPIYHGPARVRALRAELEQAWQQPNAARVRTEKTSYARIEIVKVLELFHHAALRGECVVSVLERPRDVEGFDWVKMPYVVGTPKLAAASAETETPAGGAPRRRPMALTGLHVLGATVGLGAWGILGLCLWHYRRQAVYRARRPTTLDAR